jgi:hypothetical protein
MPWIAPAEVCGGFRFSALGLLLPEHSRKQMRLVIG